ncbi:DUF4091 domain-containing protein [Paenibacillus rhizovicinus]|uniref:DUF4091 domain-containing protein n=1 Tax=Paenibacillus rhizovicinus TaxID=2704463 RepID=A0A6C0NYZ8_9BACL|nr:glycoside hydrolase domain-containing protein [Paenibacillus rhizovicinus]QHW31447.1 DUF4091 domain-containing protein [Paenibacillus rhizovicinus]
MDIYLIKDYARVDGVTGQFVEREYGHEFEKFDRELVLHTARNQHVSFQVIVNAAGEPVDSADISFDDLRGPGRLSAKDAEAFVEWFHETEGQAIPDCLIPLNSGYPFRIPQHADYLPGQQVGALWVDWFVPRDAAAGTYEGVVRVRANADEKEFVLRLVVHAVTVPDQSLMTADLNAYADSISPVFPHLSANPNRYEDGSFFDVERQVVAMAREHRSLYHNLGYKHSGIVIPSFAPELEGEGKNIRVKSWELFDRHFGPYLDGTAFADSRRGAYPIEYLYLPFHVNWPARFEKWGKKGFRTEVRRIMAEFIRHFEEKGWTRTKLELFLNHKKQYRFYPFTLDEIWYEHDEEPFEQYYDIIKDTYDSTSVPFLFRTDESNHYGNHYHNKYADMCDLWVVNAGMFSWFPDSIEAMKHKGNVVWLYGGVIRKLSSNFMTLFSWPMQTFMTGADGFCVWNAFGHGTSDYLKAPNADEIIMYPGSRFGIEGPLPSIRLKFLRNAMQLADVMMSTNGYDYETRTMFNRKVRDIVNGHYGFEGDNGWWKKTPDFVDTPPRIWDFSAGGLVEQACSPEASHGKSPRLIECIHRDVLTYLGGSGLFPATTSAASESESASESSSVGVAQTKEVHAWSESGS